MTQSRAGMYTEPRLREVMMAYCSVDPNKYLVTPGTHPTANHPHYGTPSTVILLGCSTTGVHNPQHAQM